MESSGHSNSELSEPTMGLSESVSLVSSEDMPAPMPDVSNTGSENISLSTDVQGLVPAPMNSAASSSGLALLLEARKGKKVAPITTAPLRRSTRNNKYDGFCITQTQESRIPKSKVKPRIIPSAVSNVNSSVHHM